MDNLNKFFSGKRVFITGHTGFKGSWLTSVLIKLGSKVCGYSKIDEKKNQYIKLCYSRKIKNIYGDILNFKKLEKSLKNFKPDIIFHLAAQALVSKSYSNPYNTFQTNTVGTLNILDITRNLKNVKSLVIITSDKCYRNIEIKRGYNENDVLGGDDPYSASKAAAEIIFNAYNKSFYYQRKKLGIATTRAGNVIGGGDWSKDRIIPDCIKSINKKNRLIIRNPNSTRPWQHVLEPVFGYLILAMKLYKKPEKFTGSWNFGPLSNETMSVINIVDLLFKNLSLKKKISIKKGVFKEANLLKLNSNKSLKKLKWKNFWNMRKSILETAKWYKGYLKKSDIKKITNFQIEEYLKLYD